MNRFLIFIFVLAALVACKKDDSKTEIIEEKAKRTVFVYIAGENSLSSYIRSEIAEMKTGSKEIGNDNLVVYVDAADSKNKPYMMRLKNGEVIDSTAIALDSTQISSQLDKKYQLDPLTSDPIAFENILDQMITKYPAPEYGFVIWGHADGWKMSNDTIPYVTPSSGRHRSVFIDSGNNTTSNRGKVMNIQTLAKILDSKFVLGTGKKLKFILADCCQFQCVESMYELRNVADYIIGSPAEIPAEGAPYNTVVPAMFDQSNTFYEKIFNAYFAQEVSGLRCPLSVVKTSEMEQLAQATKIVLQSFVPHLSTIYPDMEGLIYYSGRIFEEDQKFMYDMNDFIRRYASESEYANWKQAFNQAVVCKNSTIDMNNRWATNNEINFSDFVLNDERYGGLSMFVPQNRWTYSAYNKNISKTNWYYAAGLKDIGWDFNQ